MADDSGEKTFAPTAKRKREAVGSGDVLRSRELTIAVGVLTGAVWLRVAGPWLMDRMCRVLRAGLTWDRHSLEHFDAGALLWTALSTAMPPVIVLGAMVLAASLTVQLGFGDGIWVIENIMPKPGRLNPANGFKRIFGVQGWIEIGKALAKLALLGSISWFWFRGRYRVLLGLGSGELHSQLAYANSAFGVLIFSLAGGLLIIAMIDFPIQWLRRTNRLKMSLQEVRDENKETDGNPQRKAAQRRIMRTMAMSSIRKAMKQAQFVVTNPSHFAVVMVYDPALAPAPVVLAKGRDEKAFAIRELAAEMKVPVLEYPMLARAVYYTTRENQMIREDLYVAVAAVLAFVLSLRRGESPPAPNVDVPLELRFDSDGRPAITTGNSVETA